MLILALCSGDLRLWIAKHQQIISKPCHATRAYETQLARYAENDDLEDALGEG